MKFIVQRVCSAACRVDDEVTGSIQKGFMVLIGISDSDTKEIAEAPTWICLRSRTGRLSH